MKSFIPFFFCFAVILSQSASAQKTDIRGVVEDSTSGEKLPYVTVTILNASRGAVTNNNGFYLIAGISWGTYEITASTLGYVPQKIKVRVAGRNPITVSFKLVPQPVEVQEVIVLGGRKTELSEINTNTHVLGQQELQRIPVAAQGDLLRSLQIIPGIVSSSDVTSKFYVRGGAGDQNLILFDGMKIYNPYHAFGIFSIFDPDIVRTAEVYTGSFPAGYGGRLSSVVNIQSQDGNISGVHGNANLNFVSGKLLLEGPISGNNSWIISGRKSLFSDTFDKFLRNPPPISFYDLFAKANFGSSDYGKYNANLFMSADNIISKNPDEADHRWKTNAFALKISDLIQDRVYFETVLYSSSFNITRDAKQSAIVRPAESSINDFGIRTDLTIYTESSDLYFLGFEVSGISYLYSFKSPSNLSVSVDDAAAEISTWFRYQMNADRLKSDLGIHSDVLSLLSGKNITSSLQPRFNLSYRMFDDWRCKLSFGVFTQNLITLSNEDDVISLFEAWIYLPSNSEPEKAIHYTAGIEGNIFAELSSSIQAYYKDYTSLVLYNRDKQFSSDDDYVNGTGKAYGIETLLRYKYDFLDLYLSYTLGWTTVSVNNYSYAPRYDRRHSVNFLNITKLSDNIDVAFRWEFGTGYAFSQTVGVYNRLSMTDLGRTGTIGETGSPYTVLGGKNSARLPAYHRMDLTVTYTFRTDVLNGNIGMNFVNVYDNKNILYYDRKTLQTITMLPFLPTAFIKLEF